ncbi:MAG: substrate-binding domain-containing protein [Verrucomicrobia bacterium]|nr:substrate-binding domain-containing protein [Verrucomicrobiota bacterium]
MTTQQLMKSVLRDFFESGYRAVGGRLPTTRELALRYQASYTTVGKAVALLEEEGWLTRRHGSGIYVAALPGAVAKAKRQIRIGYVTADMRQLGHRVFEGLDGMARSARCVVEVAMSNWRMDEEHRQIEQMQVRGVHGIVLYPIPRPDPGREYLGAEFRRLPIVVVDLYQSNMKRPHVIFDNWWAGREITRHLLAAGRREIVFLKHSPGIAYRSIDDRVAGYQRAMVEAGGSVPTEWVVPFMGTGPGKPEHHAALERVLNLKPRPTAIITPYDPYARATIAWLRARGIAAPKEITVVGFDNLAEENWHEPFPTTQPDFIRMGERAAEMLLQQIASGKQDETEIVLPCPLALPGGDYMRQDQPTQLAFAER